MTQQFLFRIACIVLLFARTAGRAYFMWKVRCAAVKRLPEARAVKRESRRGMFMARVVMTFVLMTFLTMYLIAMTWIDLFNSFLPGWLRWLGFSLGFVCVIFWIWTQIHLDTQWSVQLQLTREYALVHSGPCARIRHPLFSARFSWAMTLSLLSHWIFLAVCLHSVVGMLMRVPKVEQRMIEALGDEYTQSMKGTGCYFPKF